jgi:hypothetical protein
LPETQRTFADYLKREEKRSNGRATCWAIVKIGLFHFFFCPYPRIPFVTPLIGSSSRPLSSKSIGQLKQGTVKPSLISSDLVCASHIRLVGQPLSSSLASHKVSRVSLQLRQPLSFFQVRMSAATGRSVPAKPWHDEYARKLSHATSFEGRKAFLAFCRSKGIGNPSDIADVGSALLEQAGGSSASSSSLGFEHGDVQEQTAVAELLCGRVDKAERRVELLNAAHSHSARATRLKGLLAEAKGEPRAAKIHYDEVLNGGLNAAHAPTLKRKVALAKGKLSGAASVDVPSTAASFPLSLLHDGISDDSARDAVKELSSYLSLYSGDADAVSFLRMLSVAQPSNSIAVTLPFLFSYVISAVDRNG